VVSQPEVYGWLDTGADWDYFRLTAPASGVWVFESSPSMGDVYGQVYNSTGTLIAFDDDGGPGYNFRVSTTLTAGSVYYVAIRNYSSSTTQTGPYTITATPPDDRGSTLSTASAWAIASQSQVAGSLEVAGDWDYYTFTAPTSGVHRFQSGPMTGDVYGHLFDSSGALIASDDDSGGSLNFQLSARLTAGQRYYVAIRNYSPATSNTGAYTITVTRP
jgi:hypothetical protein